jgi:hypothetical protein
VEVSATSCAMVPRRKFDPALIASFGLGGLGVLDAEGSELI